MPLLNAPLPRMAGRLSFMRAACSNLEDVRVGDLVIVGLPVEDIDSPNSGQSLAPRALRETSVYFGWHANPQFAHPVDVDDRRVISAAGMFDRMSDLGDLRAPNLVEGLAEVDRTLGALPATAVYLGGSQALIDQHLSEDARPLVRLGGMSETAALTLAPLSGSDLPPDPQRTQAEIDRLVRDHIGSAQSASVVFDLSVFKTNLSGLCDRPRLGGCTLPEVTRWLSVLGETSVSSIFLTGLNPTLSGMGIIKTGQRLMVTALLGFIYAKLGAARAKPQCSERPEAQRV